MSYFLVALSNRANLELCIEYALAGFTNSISGLWTFSDIREGDFISFLYGAHAINLYRVRSKEAVKNAEAVPPWPSITFKQSGMTYYFPFRLRLDPVRAFSESIVRREFAYVAENLLLRGGYGKTHFQADQTTLQSVSQMGILYTAPVEQLDSNQYDTFIPRLTTDKAKHSPPEVFRFHEFILQALVRHYLCSTENCKTILNLLGIDDLDPQKLEVLGEKALAEGHVDILLKEATPIGIERKIIVEVKMGPAISKHIEQLHTYASGLGGECIGAVLIARSFPDRVIKLASAAGMKLLSYGIGLPGSGSSNFTFPEALNSFRLHVVR